MDSYADLARRLESLIRFGTILAIQPQPPRVRVQSGGLHSTWLPWLTLRAGSTRTWSPPTVGEQCLLLSPSGEPAAGVVLLGLYAEPHPSPSNSLDEQVCAFPDGAVIRYHHGTGSLSATGIKTARVQASQRCTVDCPQSVFTGDVQINGNLTVDGQTLAKSLLTYLAGMAGQAGASGKTVISGAIEHQGHFANHGTLSSNGVVLDKHNHPDPHGGHTGVPS
ncbi:phage baseplate assembly protein V [Chitinivorax sp. B]|uniref:phage baseplate assembly protein V n=1 Tax=Chitinivorax sp. B TaxID=2502235 RepID=UPI0010F877DA|nr:phage baseplate assembly protein V [Chitinivorax sp. B]